MITICYFLLPKTLGPINVFFLGGVVLGIEPRASCMLDTYSTTELHSLQFFLILSWDSVLLSCPGGLANMQFSSLSLPGSCNQRCMPPCTVKNSFKNVFSFQRFCKCNAIVLLKPKYFYFQPEKGNENHQETGTTHKSTNAEAWADIGQFLFPEWCINLCSEWRRGSNFQRK